MPHRAVIFDCDGTLVDSETIGIEVLLTVAERQGASWPAGLGQADVANWVAALRGLSMKQCLTELERCGSFTFPHDVEGLIRQQTALEFRERLREVSGARDFVSRLQVPFCVASSGPRAKIELSLGLTGMLPHFEGRIFSSYDIGSWKPQPDLFLHAARALNVAPEHCAVIEDSQPGVDAGVAAGMFVYVFGDAELVLPSTARGVRVRDYAELEACLPSLLVR